MVSERNIWGETYARRKVEYINHICVGVFCLVYILYRTFHRMLFYFVVLYMSFFFIIYINISIEYACINLPFYLSTCLSVCLSTCLFVSPSPSPSSPPSPNRTVPRASTHQVVTRANAQLDGMGYTVPLRPTHARRPPVPPSAGLTGSASTRPVEATPSPACVMRYAESGGLGMAWYFICCLIVVVFYVREFLVDRFW